MGDASLVWITPKAEEHIAYCARVSRYYQKSDVERRLGPERLIKFCLENRHWSVFEMANACIEIVTSRDVATQIIRHRSMSFQEFSQRYSSPAEISGIDEKLFDLSTEAVSQMRASLNRSMTEYLKLLGQGVPREVARKILPLQTETILYANGTIRSWIHYLQARLDSHAQADHRALARKIYTILDSHLPTIFKCCRDLGILP